MQREGEEKNTEEDGEEKPNKNCGCHHSLRFISSLLLCPLSAKAWFFAVDFLNVQLYCTLCMWERAWYWKCEKPQPNTISSPSTFYLYFPGKIHQSETETETTTEKMKKKNIIITNVLRAHPCMHVYGFLFFLFFICVVFFAAFFGFQVDVFSSSSLNHTVLRRFFFRLSLMARLFSVALPFTIYIWRETSHRNAYHAHNFVLDNTFRFWLCSVSL